MQHVLLGAGHDEHLDCRNMDCDIVNKLPVCCKVCGLTDLDYIPQPYALIKSKTLVPNEIEMAHAGNLLIRDRIKQVLELVAPGQCLFYPTVYQKTNDLTPWHLAVPQNQVDVATLGGPLRYCNECGEHTYVHPGTHYREIHFGYLWLAGVKSQRWTNESPHDILKTSTWYTSGPPAYPETSRMVYLSVRLLHLLLRLNVNMIYEMLVMRPNPNTDRDQPKFIEEPLHTPSAEDLSWIAQQLVNITAAGIPLQPAGTVSKADNKWFTKYLKEHRRAAPATYELKKVEKELMLKLPKSYVKFIQSVGLITFKKVDDQEVKVKLLHPNKLHELDPELLDESSKERHAVVFAETDYGDVFCFDIQPGQQEYAVYQLKHEVFVLEPYTENFAQCIKRFTGE